jgi:amidase
MFAHQKKYTKCVPYILFSLTLLFTGCGENSENKNTSNHTVSPISTPSYNLNGIEYLSVSELSKKIQDENISSRAIVQYYMNRIAALDKSGPNLNAVIELNPDALVLADQLDLERKQGKSRGPLHGIPILIKDNIDTADKMQTSAGSLAMIGQPALNDAFIVKKLREAGAIIIGKTNLSEWSFFRDDELPNGWSGRGGQTKNPFILSKTPCGSSSGSAVAVSAGFSPISVGTETDGSIICPAEKNGVVGIRPTLGFVSRSGIIPITPTQDTAGPIARNVYDAALLLNVLVGTDSQDQITQHASQYATDFTQSLKEDGLKGKRLGYSNENKIGGSSPFEKALEIMQQKGAILIPLEASDVNTGLIFEERNKIFAIDFKHHVNRYLSTRKGLKIQSVAELIAFNQHTPGRLPNGNIAQQQSIEAAEKTTLNEAEHQTKFNLYKQEAQKSIDLLIDPYRLDAIIGEELAEFAATAGYPGITVPSSMHNNLPTGIYFVAKPWQEANLLSIAYGYEQATKARRNPTFLQQ